MPLIFLDHSECNDFIYTLLHFCGSLIESNLASFSFLKIGVFAKSLTTPFVCIVLTCLILRLAFGTCYYGLAASCAFT